jgi:spore coat protein U-like protein
MYRICAMKPRKLGKIVSAALLAMSSGAGFAAINCSVSATNITTNHVPTAGPTLVTGSYTVNCLRDSATSDPSSINYDLQANNGENPNTSGTANRARLGATSFYYNYELYRSAGVTDVINRWQIGFGRRFNGTVTFAGTALIASDGPRTFWLNIPIQTEDPAGSYTDRVTMTLNEVIVGGADRLLDGASGFDVTINTVKRCVFSSSPTPLNFVYTSFQTTAATPTADSTFQVRCTRNAIYSVQLDNPNPGVLLGLKYNLTLNRINTAGNLASPLSVSGNSLDQNFRITGSIPAGQAGACAGSTCSASQQRTLTITY